MNSLSMESAEIVVAKTARVMRFDKQPSQGCPFVKIN